MGVNFWKAFGWIKSVAFWSNLEFDVEFLLLAELPDCFFEFSGRRVWFCSYENHDRSLLCEVDSGSTLNLRLSIIFNASCLMRSNQLVSEATSV